MIRQLDFWMMSTRRNKTNWCLEMTWCVVAGNDPNSKWSKHDQGSTRCPGLTDVRNMTWKAWDMMKESSEFRLIFKTISSWSGWILISWSKSTSFDSSTVNILRTHHASNCSDCWVMLDGWRWSSLDSNPLLPDINKNGSHCRQRQTGQPFLIILCCHFLVGVKLDPQSATLSSLKLSSFSSIILWIMSLNSAFWPKERERDFSCFSRMQVTLHDSYTQRLKRRTMSWVAVPSGHRSK